MKSSNEPTGMVFNIQRYSIEDGPGIRTTVFLKGCPLQCLWCSNPESQSAVPELAHLDSLCTGCNDCIKVCPENAVSIIPNKEKFSIRIDRDRCTGCGKCEEACLVGALKFYGQEMSVDDVYNVVMKDKSYYDRSDGGVTIGGGEPLMQADFAAALLHKLHETGIHTAVDTCGLFSTSDLDKVLDDVDLFLFDLKVMDREKHKQFTGQYNDIILRNLQVLVKKGALVNIRIPLIPGKNDSADNLDAIARFIFELDNTLHVDLLPYHRFGMGKYEMLDMEYQLKDTEYLSEEQLKNAVDVFERYGLDCEIQ
ncbi:MAG: glycyl-radical enzyme activating protein [Dehalococcoidales bacterium]|nr:glycyl-radical enzyme activating protein [Dehalococcoidales bacterium]